MYILRSSAASPFGRKVVMAASAAGLSARVVIEEADTMSESDSLRQQNPLGKIPTLLTPDGQCLFDSRTIIEFFDSLAGGGVLIPQGEGRFDVLRQQALADGLMDAALLSVYEKRFREPEHQSSFWLSHQQGKITRALVYAEQQYSAPVNGKTLHIGEIALAAALGYLDFRFGGEWRQNYLKLAAWLDTFRQALPAYDQTQAN